MKIQTVEVFVYKYNHHYKVGGHNDTPNRIHNTDYYLEPQWKHAYSKLTESCLVKITTNTGLIGWGEGQAPIVPEVPAKLIQKLFGPAILGMDPQDPQAVYDKLYHLNSVRGHTTSYTIDAMAAIDIALWDIKGKAEGLPICKLFRKNSLQKLPLYVSGLRRKTIEERLELAQEITSQGYQGIKIFNANSVASVINECEQLQNLLHKNAGLAFDAICRYSLEEARQLGKAFDSMELMWFESPLDPEDIKAHSELVKNFKTPIAVGEPLRTVRQFEPWLREKGLRIAQPDIVRCGISGGHRIISLAANYNIPLTLHVGVCTAIGVAASWHMASQMEKSMIQEHQYELFETANKILVEPLQVYEGHAILPTGHGLGIQVNEQFIRSNCTEIIKIA